MAKKQILQVRICEAKPNKMFTELQTSLIRFLIYNQAIKCARCGKKKKRMWTMLCQFRAQNFGNLLLDDGGMSFAPLTPVCDDHPVGPDKYKEAKVKKEADPCSNCPEECEI